MAIRQITIVGTGLIGGSFGLALRQRGFGGTIIGCDKPEVLETAITRGAIDRGGTDIKEAVLDSDVVVFATPVGAILSLFEKLAPTLSPDTLITDTGSTKQNLSSGRAWCLARPPGSASFPDIPWPAKRLGGIENADPELFRDAAWLITPIDPSQPYTAQQQEYLDLLRFIGARVVAIDAERHDRLCAWISHLPQMISTALASLLREELGDDEASRANRRPRFARDDAHCAQPLLDVARYRADQQPEPRRSSAALRAAIGASAGEPARARPCGSCSRAPTSLRSRAVVSSQ